MRPLCMDLKDDYVKLEDRPYFFRNCPYQLTRSNLSR